MATKRKKLQSSAALSKGGKLNPPKQKKMVDDAVVEGLIKDVKKLTYGQCLVVKRALDIRIAATR